MSRITTAQLERERYSPTLRPRSLFLLAILAVILAAGTRDCMGTTPTPRTPLQQGSGR